jgi:hypothetical protein
LLAAGCWLLAAGCCCWLGVRPAERAACRALPFAWLRAPKHLLVLSLLLLLQARDAAFRRLQDQPGPLQTRREVAVFRLVQDRGWLHLGSEDPAEEEQAAQQQEQAAQEQAQAV